MTTDIKMKYILEAALFAADEPLSADKLAHLFDEENRPSLDEVRENLLALQSDYADRGVELIQVASGYRFQAKIDCAEFIKRMWDRKPPRYSRALMETLAMIAYRQPITRGEIEDVRGVVVSSQTIKTLMERDWVKVAGHRDVPGKPALYATTKAFLDYFNLKKLSDLPPLSELVDFESLEKQLGLQLPSSQSESVEKADAENVEEVESLESAVTEDAVELSSEAEAEAVFVDVDAEEAEDTVESEALVKETI